MTSIMSNKKHIWSSDCSSWKKSDSSCTKANEDQTLGKKLHTILQVFLTGEVANMDIKVNCLMYWTKVEEAELVEASPLCHKLKLLLCFLFDVLYLVTWWPLNLWNQKHSTTHHLLLWTSTPSTRRLKLEHDRWNLLGFLDEWDGLRSCETLIWKARVYNGKDRYLHIPLSFYRDFFNQKEEWWARGEQWETTILLEKRTRKR